MSKPKSVEKQMDRIFETLNLLSYQVQRASIFALNRTAEWLKNQLARDISDEQRITLQLLRGRIDIERANRRNLQAQLACNFRSVYVKDLPDRRQTPVGVSAGGRVYPHAFIATLKSGGKPGVYRRKTKKRIPVKSVTIPIFAAAVKRVENLIGIEARRVFEKRFLREIKIITGAL